MLIKKNKKAFHNYFVEDRYEAGISLVGTEVKSLRKSRVNFRDSYAEVSGGEVFIKNLDIQPYEQGGYSNHDPSRKRKLLLHKKEINRIYASIMQKGKSVVPLSLYFKNGLVKLELGICTGKKTFDKRHTVADRERKMRARRALKSG